MRRLNQECVTWFLLGFTLTAAIFNGCGGSEPATTTSTAGGAPAGGGVGKLTITFPHALNEEHPVHKAIVRFKEGVEKRSRGNMTVKIFSSGTMGNEQELIDNVAGGSNTMTKISSTVMETKTELAKIYSLPYLFRDADHYWKVLDGPLGQELLDMALDQNLKGICYFDAGARSFYTKKKVESPKDLAGIKIRVQKSHMMDKLMSSLGALPQQIAFSELYTAIDTGVVDGAENNIPSYYTTSHYKVAPFYSYDEHVCLPDMVFINRKVWENLSPEQQQIIMDSAHEAVEFQKQLWQEKNAEYVELMNKEGVTFTQVDKTAFQEKTKVVYDEFKGTKVMEYADKIRAVQ